MNLEEVLENYYGKTDPFIINFCHQKVISNILVFLSHDNESHLIKRKSNLKLDLDCFLVKRLSENYKLTWSEIEYEDFSESEYIFKIPEFLK